VRIVVSKQLIFSAVPEEKIFSPTMSVSSLHLFLQDSRSKPKQNPPAGLALEGGLLLPHMQDKHFAAWSGFLSSSTKMHSQQPQGSFPELGPDCPGGQLDMIGVDNGNLLHV